MSCTTRQFNVCWQCNDLNDTYSGGDNTHMLYRCGWGREVWCTEKEYKQLPLVPAKHCPFHSQHVEGKRRQVKKKVCEGCQHFLWLTSYTGFAYECTLYQRVDRNDGTRDLVPDNCPRMMEFMVLCPSRKKTT